MVKQLPSINKCENEIQLLWRLERELERYNERVVDLRKNRTLGERVRNFGPINNVGFSNRFQGIYTACITFPVWFNGSVVESYVLIDEARLHDLHDFAKASFPNNLEKLKILKLERSLSVFNKCDTNLDRT